MKIGLIGGHLSPALALLDILPEEDEVVFFGRQFAFEKDITPSLEYQTLVERDIYFVAINTGRFQRHRKFLSGFSLLKMMGGFLKARKVLSLKKIDVVVGFGGYLSLPVCLAAKTLGIPFVIHEQTMEAGVANKFLARFADTVCLSWESSRPFLPNKKVVLTGNPMKQFGQVNNGSTNNFLASHDNNPLIIVTGGSTGAHAVNILIEGALPELLKKYRIIHQAGDAKNYNDFERLDKLRLSLPTDLRDKYLLHKFIEPQEMMKVMSSADLMIGRSGINTVTEILYFGIPSIFIPLPYGQKNEQLKNAQFVKDVGLGEILDQKLATAQLLSEKIQTMFDTLSEYKKNADKAKKFVVPHAAEKLYEVISYVAQKTSS